MRNRIVRNLPAADSSADVRIVDRAWRFGSIVCRAWGFALAS